MLNCLKLSHHKQLYCCTCNIISIHCFHLRDFNACYILSSVSLHVNSVLHCHLVNDEFDHNTVRYKDPCMNHWLTSSDNINAAMLKGGFGSVSMCVILCVRSSSVNGSKFILVMKYIDLWGWGKYALVQNYSVLILKGVISQLNWSLWC